MPYTHITHHRLGIMAIVVAWIIWGAHPIAAKFGLHDIPTFTLIFYRLLLSTLILLPLTIRDLKKHRITYQDLRSFFIASLLGISLNITFYFIGLERSQAIDSSLIGSFTPIMTIGAAFLFLREKLSRHEKIGVFLGFVGTLIVSLRPLLEYTNTNESQLMGNSFLILAGVSWVAFTLYTKGLFTRFSPLFITAMTIIMGMITLFPFMLWEQYQYPSWITTITPLSLGSLLYMVFFSTIGAYFLFEWGLKYVKASLAGILSSVHLLVTGLLGIVILNETISAPMILGAFFLMVGILYASVNDSPAHRHPHHRHR